jgi:hypothetical protein
MTQENLKALVKEYFNLTDIKFGEIFDENKAFKIVFEGDELELGMKVMVVTTDGQEMPAPDGTHRLEGGMVIKTENSVVTEITKSNDMVEETLEGGRKIDKGPQTMAELPKQEFPVEVQRGAEFEKPMPQIMEEEDKTTVEDIVSAVAEVVKREIADMKEEMKEMRSKMEKMAASPAEMKTLPKTKMSAESSTANIVDPVRYEMMKKLISQKIK